MFDMNCLHLFTRWGVDTDLDLSKPIINIYDSNLEQEKENGEDGMEEENVAPSPKTPSLNLNWDKAYKKYMVYLGSEVKS